MCWWTPGKKINFMMICKWDFPNHNEMVLGLEDRLMVLGSDVPILHIQLMP